MKRKQVKQTIERVHSLTATLEGDQEELPDIRDIPIMGLVIDQVLKGTPAKKLRTLLRDENIEIGMARTYSLMQIARREIAKEGYHDFALNYAWAQSNLMDIHSRAVESDDDRMRVVVIKELIDLWQLTKHEEDESKEITPAMIEEFEQKLLR